MIKPATQMELLTRSVIESNKKEARERVAEILESISECIHNAALKGESQIFFDIRKEHSKIVIEILNENGYRVSDVKSSRQSEITTLEIWWM